MPIWSDTHDHDRAPCSTRSGTATSSPRQGEGTYLLYIDLHLIHEVTTPQAFEGLKLAGRKVRRPDATFAVADHNIPTSDRSRRHRRTGIEAAGRDAGTQCRRVRRALFPDRQHRPGHRPHHRPGAGPVAARHDDRLRRQPHRDARRDGRARLRHRHLRGRARAGDADADPGPRQEHAGRGQRQRSAPGSARRT